MIAILCLAGQSSMQAMAQFIIVIYIARCLPPTLRSCTDSSNRTLFRCRVCSQFNTPDIEPAYTARYASIDLNVHESCMHVAVRVLQAQQIM